MPDKITPDSENGSTAQQDVVVVLHGWGAHWLLTALLARRLAKHFGRAINWGYRSFSKTIEDHAQRLKIKLDELDTDPAFRQIHLVTHSMGGIVGRQALLLAASGRQRSRASSAAARASP